MYSRQVSAPILKRKTSRFGLGQLIIPGSSTSNSHNCATSVVTTSSSQLFSNSLIQNSTYNNSCSLHLHHPTASSTSHLHHFKVPSTSICNTLTTTTLTNTPGGSSLNIAAAVTTPLSPRPKTSFFESFSLHYTPLPSPAPFMITQPSSTVTISESMVPPPPCRCGSGSIGAGKFRACLARVHQLHYIHFGFHDRVNFQELGTTIFDFSPSFFSLQRLADRFYAFFYLFSF